MKCRVHQNYLNKFYASDGGWKAAIRLYYSPFKSVWERGRWSILVVNPQDGPLFRIKNNKEFIGFGFLFVILMFWKNDKYKTVNFVPNRHMKAWRDRQIELANSLGGKQITW